jgi:hypothetical protein
MKNMYGDKDFMDNEILEAIYENPFQHQQQKTKVSPLTENQTNQHLDVDSLVPSLELDDHFQQYFQQDKVLQSYLYSSDNDVTVHNLSGLYRDEESQIVFSSDRSFLEYLLEEEDCENWGFENTYMEGLEMN